MTNTQLTDKEKLQQRNRELSILNDIALALNREVDLRQALQTALLKVTELLGLRTGWVWLLAGESAESYLAASINLPPALEDYPSRMEGRCYCLDTYRAGDLAGAANVNVVTCSRLKWLADGTQGLKYHASIPLYAQDKKLGVLNVASTDWRELAPEDLKLLSTVGGLVSIAIERARLFSQSVEIGTVMERNRLAREIHDTLAQGLSAIALHLETAEALSEHDQGSEPMRNNLHQALTLTRRYLEEARRSVLDLRAAPLEGRNLSDAIAHLADSLSSGDRPQIELSTAGTARPIPVRIEVGLYRITQEALTNAIQHANAERITVQTTTTPHEITLTISDDGRGFDPEQVDSGRYGLVGMNERAKLLHGQFLLQTSPDAGTKLTVRIPLDDS